VYKESAVVCDGRGIPALPVAQGKGSRRDGIEDALGAIRAALATGA